MNVNFLAAGANEVGMGMTGSGIYSGKSGALVSVITGIPTTRLLVASVPKVPGQVTGIVQGPLYNEPSDQDRLHLTTDKSLPLHTTRLLSPGTQYDFTLINKDVICFFHVKFNEGSAVQKYRYRAAAFSGVRTYDRIVSGGSRICSIFACTNDTIESCGQRFPQYSPNSTAVFEALNITAAVPIPETDEALSAKTAMYFPVTLDTTHMPLKPAHYIFEEANELLDLYRAYMFNLRNLDAELYSFGIWGREYTTDREDEDIDSTEPPPDPDSSIIHRLHTLILFFAIVALLF